MKYLLTLLAFVPSIAFAQVTFDSGNDLRNFFVDVLTFINGTLIPFILGIGFLVFVWGMFQYFIYGGANDEAKEKGRSLMVYATLGFVLVLIFWGVVNLVAQGTGFTTGNNNAIQSKDLKPIEIPAGDDGV